MSKVNVSAMKGSLYLLPVTYSPNYAFSLKAAGVCKWSVRAYFNDWTTVSNLDQLFVTDGPIMIGGDEHFFFLFQVP